MICPECNTPAQKGDTYCQNCGHQFVVHPVRTGVDPETGKIIPGTVIAPNGQVIPTSAPVTPLAQPEAKPVIPAATSGATAAPAPAADEPFINRVMVHDEAFMSAGVAAGRERASATRKRATAWIAGLVLVLGLAAAAYYVGLNTNFFGLGGTQEPSYALPVQGTSVIRD